MIETFYEQIKTFGKLIKSEEIKQALVGETYTYNGNEIRVFVRRGKPISIIVSK